MFNKYFIHTCVLVWGCPVILNIVVLIGKYIKKYVIKHECFFFSSKKMFIIQFLMNDKTYRAVRTPSAGQTVK